MPIPRISIISAVYNGEKYLRLAIDSIIQQSFTDYEFIIIDDCSTDSTPTIISSYKDKRIKYRRNEINLGQTPSLNIALKLATGKYIARIDADDIYLSEKLEKQHSFMEQNSSIAICGTFGIKIDETGKTIGSYKVPIQSEDLFFNIFFGSPLIHVSVIMRRSIILETGGYDKKYLYCADVALWSKLIKNNYKIANMPEKLIKCRLFNNSLGFINKLGISGAEGSDIIYKNISELLNIPINRKECRNIVLMLWPSSGMGIIELSNAYLKLIAIAKESYNTRMPIRAIYNLNILYFKSLVKRGIYLKSKKQFGLFTKDILKIIRIYYKHPILNFVAIMSFFIVSILSKKNIKILYLASSN